MRRRHYVGEHSDFKTYTPGTSYGVGAAPVARTVTGQAAGLINTAAIPVRWAFSQAGNLAHFLGNTLSTIGRKL